MLESARTDTGAPGPLRRQAADLKNSSGRSAAYTRSSISADCSLSAIRAALDRS